MFYTYGDNLTPEVYWFGVLNLLFLMQLIYRRNGSETHKGNLDVPANNNNNAFPVFQPYIPPSDSVSSNPFFIAVGWTCAAAFLLNDRRLYAACVALLAYLTGGSRQPTK